MEAEEMKKVFQEHLSEILKASVAYDESQANNNEVSLRFWNDGHLTVEVAGKANSDGLGASDRIEIRLNRYCMYDFCEFDPALEWTEEQYHECAIQSEELKIEVGAEFIEQLDITTDYSLL